MNKEPSNQHYIPQFYLKKWASENNQTKVWCLNKNTAEISNIHMREICCCPNLWNNHIEVSFSKLEGKWANILTKILNSKSLNSLANDEKHYFYAFLFSTRIRNPKISKPALETGKTMANEELGKPDLMERFADKAKNIKRMGRRCIESKFVSAFHPSIVLTEPKFKKAYEQIERMYKGIKDISYSEYSFITSDNPYSVITRTKEKFNLIVLPLSPKCLFFATRTYPTYQIVKTRLSHNIVPIVNRHIIKKSDYIISKSKSELEDIKSSIQ
jgi:hypothetical protein